MNGDRDRAVCESGFRFAGWCLEAERAVFKAPAEVGDEDEHSASAPLLSMASGGRATSSEEERELWEAEGPNSGVRGTLLDGIANVSSRHLRG